MRNMKHKKYLLAALAASLIVTAGVGSAAAYFTTYAEAKGTKEITLGYETHIDEDFKDLTKIVTIKSEENSQPVYVRARAYTGSQYTLTIEGTGWTDGGDGYWYYDEIVYGGESTTPLNVTLGGIPEDAEVDDSINIAVLYESTPVVFDVDADGNATPYADWTMILDKGGDK